jgi:hypothetical protein
MDTDELSDKAYKAILGQAESFHHDLTLQFGMLSYDCKDEKEYIQMSIELIQEMMKYEEEEFDNIFLTTRPVKRNFM